MCELCVISYRVKFLFYDVFLLCALFVNLNWVFCMLICISLILGNFVQLQITNVTNLFLAITHPQNHISYVLIVGYVCVRHESKLKIICFIYMPSKPKFFHSYNWHLRNLCMSQNKVKFGDSPLVVLYDSISLLVIIFNFRVHLSHIFYKTLSY